VEELFEGPYAPLGSLSGKTKVPYLLGLITKDERDRINAVRQVRNVFAHEIDAGFEYPKIKKICAKPIVDCGRMCSRDEFLHIAQNTVLPLLYRD
jgi:regulator of PEP synthase PpsR (kinase-PPPase family)